MVNAATDRTAPVRSRRPDWGVRVAGTSQRPATRATATIGRLTRKIESQLKWASSQPPATGPIATPRPLTADHRPMALVRSAGSVNTLVMMDKVAGMMNAPPIPMTARAAMSSAVVCVNAAASDPAAKTASPAASAWCRP